MNRALPHLAFALSSLLVFAAAACGDDASNNTTSTSGTGTTTGTGGAGGSGTGGGTTTSTGTGGMPMECEGPGFGGNEVSVPMTSVEATILDLDSDPVAGVQTLLCGTDICLDPAVTGADGHVLIAAAQGQMMKLPALKYGDGLLYGRFAIPLTEPVTVFPTVVTPLLPPLAEGQTLAAGMTVTSGDVTLTIPAETEVEIDYLIYDEVEKEGFRTATIPDPSLISAVDPTLGLEIAYAVAPVETTFCPAVMVTVPNTPGWAAGAEVEFFLHSVDVAQHWAPYAGWAKMSDGQVSADGATISTSPDGGMPVLSVFGIRLKP